MSAVCRTTLEFLELGRRACLAGGDEVQGKLDDAEIPAALHAADLMEAASRTVSPEAAAQLYYYDRAIEMARAEKAAGPSGTGFRLYRAFDVLENKSSGASALLGTWSNGDVLTQLQADGCPLGDVPVMIHGWPGDTFEVKSPPSDSRKLHFRFTVEG
jgi:hypothetical protein